MISIVIPAYNAELYLQETLDSVLAQSRTDWELVVVDDGSTDGTLELAGRYAARDSRVRTLHQPNAGIAAARNRGLRETDRSSQYAIFLDADDVWELDTLAALAAALEAEPEAVAAHGLHRCMDAQSRLATGLRDEMLARGRPGIADGRLVHWPAHEPTSFAVLAVANCIMTSGQVLIRRAAIEAVGPCDPGADGAEDWDLWLRLALRGNLAFVNRPVLRYRRHDRNVSRQWDVLERGRCYVRRKLLSWPALSVGQQRVLRLGYQWSKWELSRARWRWAAQSMRERRYYAAAQQVRHAVIERAQFQLLCLRRDPRD